MTQLSRLYQDKTRHNVTKHRKTYQSRILQDELTRVLRKEADALISRELMNTGQNEEPIIAERKPSVVPAPHTPAYSDHLEQTIRAAKSAYCEAESVRPLTRFEFLMEQSRYIRKRWWILQGLLLAALGLMLIRADSSFYTARSMGIAGSAFAVLILPELWKNRSCGATEVEGAAYYSLRQIYAARLTLFAMADLLLITAFGGLAVTAGGVPVTDLAAQFLLPFNVTCCICFQTLYSRRMQSEIFSVFLCGCWIAVWVEIVLGKLYDRITLPVWCGLLALSAVYLVFCVACGQRNLHKLLEAEPIWN